MVRGMYSVGKSVGLLDKEQNPDSSNVTCNIRNGESRSTKGEKTRIKKEREKMKNYRFVVTEQA